jgi:hypothetical protein
MLASANSLQTRHEISIREIEGPDVGKCSFGVHKEDLVEAKTSALVEDHKLLQE